MILLIILYVKLLTYELTDAMTSWIADSILRFIKHRKVSEGLF